MRPSLGSVAVPLSVDQASHTPLFEKLLPLLSNCRVGQKDHRYEEAASHDTLEPGFWGEKPRFKPNLVHIISVTFPYILKTG